MVNITTFLLDFCLCLSFVFAYAMIIYFLPRSIYERILPMLPENVRMFAFYALVLLGIAFQPIAQKSARVFWKKCDTRLTRRLVAMIGRKGISNVCCHKTLLIMIQLLNPVLLTSLALHFGMESIFCLAIILTVAWYVSVVVSECIWHVIGRNESLLDSSNRKRVGMVLKAHVTWFKGFTVKQILVIMIYVAACIACGHVLCKIIIDRYDANEYLEDTASCGLIVQV